jgi:hypothetical protein
VSSFVPARESPGKRERRTEARPAELLEAALDKAVVLDQGVVRFEGAAEELLHAPEKLSALIGLKKQHAMKS